MVALPNSDRYADELHFLGDDDDDDDDDDDKDDGLNTDRQYIHK